MRRAVRLSSQVLSITTCTIATCSPKIGVQTETVGDRTTTYFNDELPKDIAAMLKPYRAIGGGTRSFA